MKTPNANKRGRKAHGKHADTLSLPLEAFLTFVFLPLVGEDRSKTFKAQCRRAVREFSTAIEHPAALADLNTESFERFKEKLTNVVSPAARINNRKRLLTIWHYASKLGYVSSPPCTSAVAKPKLETPAHVKPPMPTAQPESLRAFYESDYKPHKLITASHNHIVECTKVLLAFEAYSGRQLRPDELNDEIAAAFLRHQLEKGILPVSVNKYRAILFAIWRYAHERGKCSVLPNIKKLRVKRDEPDAWTEAEMGRMIQATEVLSKEPPYGPNNAADYMRSLLLVAWWTGLRAGSLFSLRVDDIDLLSGWIIVRGETMKNGRGKQFRVGQDAIDAIRGVIIPGAKLLFPYRYRRIYFEFDKCLEAADIPKSKRRGMTKFHKVRRTVATSIAMRSGLAAASNHLGHSNEQITMRYVDPSKLPGNDATAILPKLNL